MRPVSDIPKEAVFISDSQDVAKIKVEFPMREEYDSYFVIAEDGEYKAIWGIFGIVPNLDKPAYRVL